MPMLEMAGMVEMEEIAILVREEMAGMVVIAHQVKVGMEEMGVMALEAVEKGVVVVMVLGEMGAMGEMEIKDNEGLEMKKKLITTIFGLAFICSASVQGYNIPKFSCAEKAQENNSRPNRAKDGEHGYNGANGQSGEQGQSGGQYQDGGHGGNGGNSDWGSGGDGGNGGDVN
jgi:hypothetical protein